MTFEVSISEMNANSDVLTSSAIIRDITIKNHEKRQNNRNVASAGKRGKIDMQNVLKFYFSRFCKQ